MAIAIPKGVFDILPGYALAGSDGSPTSEAWRSSELWQWVESEIRTLTRLYHYEEIRTPIFERTELLSRGVGETSDIVSKEMYTFQDKGDRMMTLRPEGTAPVIRSFIENNLSERRPIHKLFYIAPMFRYERPQSGRYRQHHQFGVEAVGDGSPEQDAEIIDLLVTLYRRLGIRELSVNLNSLGGAQSRVKFREALQRFLEPNRTKLSEDSQRRFDTNPLRILDSKDPIDQPFVANAPSILDFLSEEERGHFESVQKLLTQLGIEYRINSRLVRGLDYYNGTVFEVVTQSLGAQNSIGGGGRYDGLIKTLGGADLPSIGFGTGLERIIQTVLAQRGDMRFQQGPQIYLLPIGDQARSACFTLLHRLRSNGVAADMDFSGKKLKKAMAYANDCGARFVALMGDNELARGEVTLKEMETGKESTLPVDSLLGALTADLKN